MRFYLVSNVTTHGHDCVSAQQHPAMQFSTGIPQHTLLNSHMLSLTELSREMTTAATFKLIYPSI